MTKKADACQSLDGQPLSTPCCGDSKTCDMPDVSGNAGHACEAGLRSALSIPDRRGSPRYSAQEAGGWLGQWSDQGFDVFDVVLLDLSRSGAGFEMEEQPEHPTYMLGLEILREAGCLEVKVVRTTEGCQKRYRVHVAFTQPCDDGFYTTAVEGQKPDDSKAPEVPAPAARGE